MTDDHGNRYGQHGYLTDNYDKRYHQNDYFRYSSRPWRCYRPWLKAVLRKARLQPGGRVLDAGCGQGFFTGLFAELGFDSVGVDLSAEGIRNASRSFGGTGARFETGDVLALPYTEVFDCVFARGLGAYCTADFASRADITDKLLSYLKRGGALIFNYHTNLCQRKRDDAWILHSLGSVRQHFGRYSSNAVYFSVRLDAAILGSWGLSAPITWLNGLLSKLTGIGGDAIALVWKA